MGGAAVSEVVLTWPEVAEAGREGLMRRIRRLAGARSGDRYGWDAERDAWGNDIEAVAAEMAFAKLAGLYWAPSVKPDYDGDVASFQVRHSTNPQASLIVYPGDADDARFVLVVGAIPRFRVCGWMTGRMAKAPGWDARGRLRVPGYLVPQSALRSVEHAAVAA